MSSDTDIFYLKDTRTGKYHSQTGLTEDKSKASKFTQTQLKRRLNVPITYTNIFKEKMLNAFLAMEPVSEDIGQFLFINSKIKYEDFDMLDCDVEYHYKNSIIKGRTVYSVAHDYISECKDNKSGLIKVVLNVRGIVGKINPD